MDARMRPVPGCTNCAWWARTNAEVLEKTDRWRRALRDLTAASSPKAPGYLPGIVEAVEAAIEWELSSVDDADVCDFHFEQWASRRLPVC